MTSSLTIILVSLLGNKDAGEKDLYLADLEG